MWVGTIDGAATSGFWLDLAMGVCSRDFGWGIVVFGSLVGQLLLAFFFLLALLCQISLAFFELVVWFGQEVTFDGGNADLSGINLMKTGAIEPRNRALCHHRPPSGPSL